MPNAKRQKKNAEHCFQHPVRLCGMWNWSEFNLILWLDIDLPEWRKKSASHWNSFARFRFCKRRGKKCFCGKPQIVWVRIDGGTRSASISILPLFIGGSSVTTFTLRYKWICLDNNSTSGNCGYLVWVVRVLPVPATCVIHLQLARARFIVPSHCVVEDKLS